MWIHPYLVFLGIKILKYGQDNVLRTKTAMWTTHSKRPTYINIIYTLYSV